MPDGDATDRALRTEAEEILDGGGLRELLGSYGTVHVTGSYALGLMAWRDLDLYLESVELSCLRFFELGGRIAALLSPARMQFIDNRTGHFDDVPRGLYWGVRLGDLPAGAWKIDIWGVPPAACAELIRYCDGIAARLTPPARRIILEIKSQCWRDPEYRKSFSGVDIYKAVLDHGVTDAAGFRKFLTDLK